MTKAKELVRKTADGFHLNEPRVRIAGGPSRPSLILKDARFAAIRRRQLLNTILTLHDPDGSRLEIRATDLPILRLAAREGVSTNQVPVLRRNAILALGQQPSVENLSLLSELAQLSEDFYTRGNALIALGLSGTGLAAPLIASGLRARDAYERDAASVGLLALARKLGPGAVRTLQDSEKDKKIRIALRKILSQLEHSHSTKRRKQISSTR